MQSIRRLMRGLRPAWLRAGCTALACAALGACAVAPAQLGEAPGDYVAFMREVMAEAAKAPAAAPQSASRAVQSAGEWLGGEAVATQAATQLGTGGG